MSINRGGIPDTPITDAIAAERQIKGWSRAKKEALIAENWDRLQELAKRPTARTERSSKPPASH
ncbi:hypothetical protein GCM10007887_01380 [Methylobacterium haplocladii]|uniref:GIY-YIG domain-containing protein n=1 Tax=Methylobacterium haplocladii TaxID=1176176 RepID=A0A512IJL7_9HYPH|nr:hypothetical protein MHA02_02720 [Methylobacterium haplocladii]GLS57483.1 hypothetical protein GCM10007887_01380 [Methylobacterium haplocladii]